MDTKIEIKEEESLSEDLASQNASELVGKVITVNSNSNAVLLNYNDGDMAIKTEIKTETSFPHFGLQEEKEFLLVDPVMKLENYNTEHEIEIKQEPPWWLKTETSAACDDAKDEDFPPATSSRVCTEVVSGAVSGMSPLILAEVSGRDTSFYNGKDRLEYEIQKSDVTEMPIVEEYVLSEQSDKRSEEGEMSIRPSYLEQKTLMHQDKRLHKCKTCDKSFTCLSHLKMHSLIHEGTKSRQCTICGKSFTRASYWRIHNMMHEGKKPHQCTICGKSFAQLSNLKIHNMTHEGIRPYQCKTCDKTFTWSSNLNTHNLIHEGKKPHSCKICDKSFARSSDLKKHYLIHEGKKPYQCKTCDKRFSGLYHLKRHYLIHEGKRPHECEICSKGFTELSALKIHNMIHEGKKPHKCETCDKSFIRSSDLKKHYLIHEGKSPV